MLGVSALEQTKHDNAHGGQDYKDDHQRHSQHHAAVLVVGGDVAIRCFRGLVDLSRGLRTRLGGGRLAYRDDVIRKCSNGRGRGRGSCDDGRGIGCGYRGDGSCGDDGCWISGWSGVGGGSWSRGSV